MNYSEIISNKLQQHHKTIQKWIKSACFKKNVSNTLQEELLGELALYLLEPFWDSSIEESIRISTLQKRKENLIKLIEANDEEGFLKYCHKWIQNNTSWTDGNLLYKRTKLMATQIETEDNQDLEIALQVATELYWNVDESDMLEHISLINDIVKSYDPWWINLYQLSIRDGLSIKKVALKTGLSTTTIFNLLKTLKEKIKKDVLATELI